MKNPRIRALIRDFALEALIYSALVVTYVFLVLRLPGEPLKELFTDHLMLYASVALALIVVQGVQVWNWSLPFW